MPRAAPVSVEQVGHHDLGDGAWIALCRGFVDPSDASALLERLLATLPLRLEHVTVFGKRRPQPRLTAWCADPGCTYVYSGLALAPEPWTPELAALRARLAAALDHPFNSVLANLYRDGQDSMGWHADDEPVFGEDPLIASLSLGAPRRFLLRRRSDRETFALSLGGGDLLVMGGATQRLFQHAVPKTAGAGGPRLNLTFRWFRG